MERLLDAWLAAAFGAWRLYTLQGRAVQGLLARYSRRLARAFLQAWGRVGRRAGEVKRVWERLGESELKRLARGIIRTWWKVRHECAANGVLLAAVEDLRLFALPPTDATASLSCAGGSRQPG